MEVREDAHGQEIRVLLPDALGNWAVVKILQEPFRLITTRFRLFLFFILAFYVPGHSLMPYLILKWSGDRDEPPPEHNLAVLHHGFSFFMTSLQVFN